MPVRFSLRFIFDYVCACVFSVYGFVPGEARREHGFPRPRIIGSCDPFSMDAEG